jgi:hypothetical protein
MGITQIRLLYGIEILQEETHWKHNGDRRALSKETTGSSLVLFVGFV